MLTVYGYMKCDTCRKAIKWLDANGIDHAFIDITADPPSAKRLRAILKGGRYTLRQLFNTSGVLYREMRIKDRLPDMTEAEAISLLAANGKLIKRPIVTDGERFTVGFKPEEFENVWG